MKTIFNNTKAVWNTALKSMVVLLIMALFGCGSDEPMPEAPNVKPIATLTVVVNTNKTLSGTLTGTDSDGTISMKEVVIKQGNTVVASMDVSGNNWSSNPLNPGNYTITGTVVDNDGADASDSDTKTIVGLEITTTNGVVSFDENETTSQEVVVTLDNPNNISGVTHSINADFQPYFEVVGNELKIKSGITFDFETFPNGDVQITSSASGEDDVVNNVTFTVVDKDERLEDVLIKATHCLAGFAKVDVADNDKANQNIVEYRIDHTGALTSQTFADVKALIDGQTSFPAALTSANFLDIITRQAILVTNDNGNAMADWVYYYTDGTNLDNSIIHRKAFSFTNLSDGSNFTHNTEDQITRRNLQKIYGAAYVELKAEYGDYNDIDAFLLFNSNTGNDFYYSAFTVSWADFMARQQSGGGVIANDTYVYGFAQAMNIVYSQDSASDARALGMEYFNNGRIVTTSLLQGCN